jgi:hypothetical protein
MTTKTQYLILKDSMSESSMHALAKSNPWFLSEKVDRDPDNDIPFELIWETVDEQTSIHYIEDELVKFPYVVVKGKDVDKVVSKIRSKLDIYSDEELVQMFESASQHNEKMKAVARLGVASPQQFDSRFFNLLQQAFSDPDPEVRRTAVWCIGYASWAEFREVLEQIVASDPDESVREDAAYMLESYKQHNIG